MAQKVFQVPKALAGLKIDLALAQLLSTEAISRRKLRRSLDSGLVFVNGKKVQFASNKVAYGDKITLDISAEEGRTLPKVVLKKQDLVFQDKDLVVLNKPSGLLSTPSQNSREPHAKTQVEALLSNRYRLEACHRLDKETSGLLVLAATPFGLALMNRLFKERKVQKTYLALCHGLPKQAEWSVECFLSPISKTTGKVEQRRSGGKPSQSRFELVQADEELGLSLIRCHPSTGRSHQLRVHLELSSLPLLGDKKYGSVPYRSTVPEELRSLARASHFLHAEELRFIKQQTPLQLKAELPEAFKQVLAYFS